MTTQTNRINFKLKEVSNKNEMLILWSWRASFFQKRIRYKACYHWVSFITTQFKYTFASIHHEEKRILQANQKLEYFYETYKIKTWINTRYTHKFKCTVSSQCTNVDWIDCAAGMFLRWTYVNLYVTQIIDDILTSFH